MPAELPMAMILVVVAMRSLLAGPKYNISYNERLPPVVAGVGQAFVHHRVEAGVLLDEDLAELAVLAEQDGLEADQLQQRQEHGDEGALGAGVAQEAARGHGLVFHSEAASEEPDHLAHGDRVFADVNHRALAGALQDVAEDADQVHGVGGDL